jgi:hypothetical protein
MVCPSFFQEKGLEVSIKTEARGLEERVLMTQLGIKLLPSSYVEL